MKQLIVLFLVFFSNLSIGQSYVKIQFDSGISNWLHVDSNSGRKRIDFTRTGPKQNYAMDLSYIRRIDENEFHAGLKLNVGMGGTTNAFLGSDWNQSFFGVRVGYMKKINRFIFGINTISNLKIQANPIIASVDGLLFKPTFVFELNPTVGVALWKDKFFLNLNYAITPLPIYNNILSSTNITHRIHYLNLGLSYRFIKLDK